ncbi:Lipid-binding putative hydrolase [Xylanibacter ruminicola]|uniref:Lipid-binding putative hydrolase n=1 Tax=Xylanibacter ruminicola TaxID=839 RepID=A0A1M7MTA8_XYLRU|nr:lipid-binding protein [Xylanibacter ruminicola]SHM93777.1 Lipid-binding putative hydrolase [Xylanibacter ruminicola]
MKKYISLFLFATVFAFGFTACDVETNIEPGGTNVEKMAGKWEVTVDAVDDAGNVLYEDPYGMGTVIMYTYNTAANTNTEMWLDDDGEFWAFKMKVDVNYANRTFDCATKDYDAEGTGQGTVTNGKVLEGAATNLHGMPNDSIVFDIVFSDDDNNLKYRISGQRYTGFYE